MQTIVISEIGENHYGRWDICRGLVHESAINGATFAKFQTYTGEQFGQHHPAYEWFKGVTMPESVHREMQQACRDEGIEFLSSPFTVRAAAFLIDQLGLDAIKVASGRVVHHDMLDFIDSRFDQVKTVYMSTGGCSMAEVTAAVKRFSRVERLYLLHCVSQYPTDDVHVNLRAMLTLRAAFVDHGIGYSDHSRGIEACMAAVALGAEVLEKHFTYSTKMPGDDHPGAMTPETLAQLVRQIERVEVMLGSPEKRMLKAEEKTVEALRMRLAEVGFDEPSPRERETSNGDSGSSVLGSSALENSGPGNRE